MFSALVMSALLMGVAGGPHCVAMCAAACGGIARACGGGRDKSALLALLAGRLVSYAVGGAVVAASVGALARVGAVTAWLHPLWVMVHVGALALGGWLLLSGRQPVWLEDAAQRVGARLSGATHAPQAAGLSGTGAGGVQVVRVFRPGRAGLLGLAWLAWPCGLLQSALVVAGLAGSPPEGASVMAAFALGSGVSLWVGPALWLRLGASTQAQTWAVRGAGAMLLVASGWALWHDFWLRFGPPICT